MRRGFTLVELMVVVGMIAVISAAMVTSVGKAQRRARIVRAETEAREITNAILAYQNYDEDGKLPRTMNEEPASEGNLDFILGKVKSRGQQVPVLYNASLVGGQILDPWGRPYLVTIKQGEKVSPAGVDGAVLRVFYPNWHRVTGGER